MQDEREWARGLTQEEFSHEFQRRNAGTDVIPSVTEWVNGHDPVYNGIPDIPAESYEIDGPAPVQTPLTYKCRGCSKEFSIAIARAGHERYCDQVVKREVPADAHT